MKHLSALFVGIVLSTTAWFINYQGVLVLADTGAFGSGRHNIDGIIFAYILMGAPIIVVLGFGAHSLGRFVIEACRSKKLYAHARNDFIAEAVQDAGNDKLANYENGLFHGAEWAREFTLTELEKTKEET